LRNSGSFFVFYVYSRFTSTPSSLRAMQQWPKRSSPLILFLLSSYSQSRLPTFPVVSPDWGDARIGVSFHEISARPGDFAFAAAAAQIALDADGVCQRLALGIGAVAACPLRLDAVAKAVEGTHVEASVVRETVRAALADIEPLSDLHASADYRRRAAECLAVRAITDAYQSAEAARAS
jgi:xanthine dehydrogenase iron-sulfur cluster and FAD-binding subunit A